MIHAYPGAAVRAAEQPLLEQGHGAALMRRAAYGLYAAAARETVRRRGRLYGARVVVLAGAGNNGGDALYAGTFLAARGAAVTAVLTASSAHADGLAAFRAGGGRVLSLAAGPGTGSSTGAGTGAAAEAAVALCRTADLILDGVLGTGGRGGLRGPAAELARALAAGSGSVSGTGSGTAGPLVIACDLPSGINADTGAAEGEHFRADLTVTFGAAKTGLLVGPGAVAAGVVECIDIGLGPMPGPPAVTRLETADLAALLPVPGKQDHKYTRGVLGLAAGSATYPGAAVLATGAALATGVGMARYLGPESVARLINATHPEAVCSTGTVPQTHVQAWLAGPGAGTDADQRRRALDAMASGLPAVIDADAIAYAEPGLGPQVVLTPHAGELTALLNRLDGSVTREQVEADPLTHALRAARITGATVLLKGWATVTAAPGGEAFSQTDGTPWLATAGSGDTLSGILGALLAADAGSRGARPAGPGHYAALAAAAASLHGRAGTLAAGSGPVEPSLLPGQIRSVLASLGR